MTKKTRRKYVKRAPASKPAAVAVVCDDPDVTFEFQGDGAVPAAGPEPHPQPPEPEPHPLSLTRGARPTDRDGTGRAARVPLGGHRAKLQAPSRPGYHRRWINDHGARIANAERGGYQFVEDEDEINETGRGAKRFVTVGTKEDGTPLKAYLMEIRQEFFDQDQQAKQSKNDEVDAAIKRGDVEGAQPQDQEKYYVPAEGIRS